MATEFTQEEAEKLVSTFRHLNIKPKSDSPEDLQNWMQDYVHSLERVKEENFDNSNHGQGEPADTKTLTMAHFPKVTSFSGDGKGGTTYDLWRYEVMCIRKEKRSSETILQAIRMSLKGEAGRVVMRLGPLATVERIISKMDSVYGGVDQTEMTLAKFYSARQHPDEDVSAWGCRLEDLLNVALTKGKVDPSESNKMLRAMFWSGMRVSIKDITGYLYEAIDDFDELRVAIRRVEQDHKQHNEEEKSGRKTVTPAKAAVETMATTTAIEKLTGMVNQLSTDVKQLKQDNRHPSYNLGRGSQFRDRPEYPARQQYQARNTMSHRYSTEQPYQTGSHDPPWRQSNMEQGLEEPTCWRCGQIGHVQLGCRVRIDHRRPLNGQKSAPRGRR